MLRRFPLFLLSGFLTVYACSVPQGGTDSASADTLSFSIPEHVKLCDTCVSTLIVHHDECTECRDIYVDSGTVYISKEIADKHLSTQLMPGLKKYFNTRDLYFADKNDFRKLWDSINWHFDRIYRIRGRVSGTQHGALLFQLESYELLDSGYAKNFR